MTAVGEKQKKIAVVMPRLSPYGGAESFALRLSDALARKGHAVDFICARVEAEPPHGVRPVVVGRFGGCRWIKIVWFAVAAEFARRRGKYDLTVGLGKTFRQDLLRIGGGPQTTFWKLSREAWPAGFPRFFKMLRRRLSPSSWATHVLDVLRFRHSREIVAVSHFVRDLILEANPHLNRDDVRVVYNRPDLTRYTPVPPEERQQLRKAHGIAETDVVIATAATNFVLKGIGPLLRALARLPQNFRLRVAGGRKPDKYLTLARRLGVADRVEFLGRVDDMPQFYRTADVFALATYYDACSNAVLEALACGCRVVSSARNGSAHFLSEEWIFSDPGDEVELARVLASAAEHPLAAPFCWPENGSFGVAPYVDLIENMLANTAR